MVWAMSTTRPTIGSSSAARATISLACFALHPQKWFIYHWLPKAQHLDAFEFVKLFCESLKAHSSRCNGCKVVSPYSDGSRNLAFQAEQPGCVSPLHDLQVTRGELGGLHSLDLLALVEIKGAADEQDSPRAELLGSFLIGIERREEQQAVTQENGGVSDEHVKALNDSSNPAEAKKPYQMSPVSKAYKAFATFKASPLVQIYLTSTNAGLKLKIHLKSSERLEAFMILYGPAIQ
jgi:hypothetical protein